MINETEIRILIEKIPMQTMQIVKEYSRLEKVVSIIDQII